MTTTAMVHVRVSGKVKAQAEKALPFDVHVPNAKTRRVLRETKNGKLHRAASVDDLMAQLNDGA